MKKDILLPPRLKKVSWCLVKIDTGRHKKSVMQCERCKGTSPYHPEIMVTLPGRQYAAIINSFLEQHADCKEKS